MTQPPAQEPGPQHGHEPPAWAGNTARSLTAGVSGSTALVVASCAAGLELASSSFVAAFVHSEGGYKAFEVILLLIAMAAAVAAALPWLRNRRSAVEMSAEVVAAAVAGFVVVFGLLQFISTLKGPRLFF